MDRIKSNGAEILPHCRDKNGFAYLGYSVVNVTQLRTLCKVKYNWLEWQEQAGTCLPSECMESEAHLSGAGVSLNYSGRVYFRTTDPNNSSAHTTAW